MTSLVSRIFVLRDPSRCKIQVYDSMTFETRGALKVNDLSDITSFCGLTSCITNTCVYVSDKCRDVVHKVVLSDDHSYQASNWRVGSGPMGLSINTVCNLLVACFTANKIQEYTTNGVKIHEICLDLSFEPYHAIQLTSGKFVVSSAYKDQNLRPRHISNQTRRFLTDDVHEVGTEGTMYVSYGHQLRSTTQREFSSPYRLSVDEKEEYILVADMWNNRIVRLNRLSNDGARDLIVYSDKCRLQRPSCLYFDVSQKRLIVGGKHRVLIFGNVM